MYLNFLVFIFFIKSLWLFKCLTSREINVFLTWKRSRSNSLRGHYEVLLCPHILTRNLNLVFFCFLGSSPPKVHRSLLDGFTPCMPRGQASPALVNHHPSTPSFARPSRGVSPGPWGTQHSQFVRRSSVQVIQIRSQSAEAQQRY